MTYSACMDTESHSPVVRRSSEANMLRVTESPAMASHLPRSRPSASELARRFAPQLTADGAHCHPFAAEALQLANKVSCEHCRALVVRVQSPAQLLPELSHLV